MKAHSCYVVFPLEKTTVNGRRGRLETEGEQPADRELFDLDTLAAGLADSSALYKERETL